MIPSHLVVLFTSRGVLANEFITLGLDFAHDEIVSLVSQRKHESKLLQDLVHLKLL